MEISTPSLSADFVRELYARMLLTRLVDEYTQQFQRGEPDVIASSRGHEAAQVASALCIEVGNDFTLPYYRDLGVVLTVGMTPYEVLRTYVLTHNHLHDSEKDTGAVVEPEAKAKGKVPSAVMHWGYHKHNTVTGSATVATQILHAAGIAFSCKLRKAAVVTVAYCGDGATEEPDFLEGIVFAAQHQLPVVFVCEQDDAAALVTSLPLPTHLEYQSVDGMDAIAVYATMLAAMRHAREGYGPVLLEMRITRPIAAMSTSVEVWQDDPLLRYQHYLEAQGMWDDEWAAQLRRRLAAEVERAWQDALHSKSADESA